MAFLTKGYITAVAEESVFGRGVPANLTLAVVGATVASPIDLSQDGGTTYDAVQESTISVNNDTTAGTLVLGLDYTVSVANGVTTVTLVAGTNFTDSDDVTVTYGAWADANVIVTDVGSMLTTDITELELNTANGSYINCPSIAGTETVSGTFTTSLLIKDDGVSEGKFNNHLLIKAGMGKFIAGGADIDFNTYSIAEVSAGTGSGDLYKFSTPADPQVSLAVRQYAGGSANATKDFTGIVPNSITFNLPTGDIAKIDVDLGGIKVEPASAGQKVLSIPSCSDAFAVKRGVFARNGVAEAKVQDLTFSIENTIADISGVESDGISMKVVTAKMVTGSFSVLLDGTANLEAFKSNADASLFFHLDNPKGDQFAIYLPKVRITSLGEMDNDGVVGEDIEVKAFNDSNGNAVYIYTKYRP